MTDQYIPNNEEWTRLQQALISLSNDILNINDILNTLPAIKKLADDARKDVNYFNEVKLPALVDDIDKRFTEMKAETRTWDTPVQKEKSRRWSFLNFTKGN